jgi:hypothetical protein
MGVAAAGQESVFTFDVNGKNVGAMGWQLRSWMFTAHETTTTMEFYSMDSGNGAYGPALDTVSVSRIR